MHTHIYTHKNIIYTYIYIPQYMHEKKNEWIIEIKILTFKILSRICCDVFLRTHDYERSNCVLCVSYQGLLNIILQIELKVTYRKLQEHDTFFLFIFNH
jgi:hypothetical protein